jgi:hypothetical protein
MSDAEARNCMQRARGVPVRWRGRWLARGEWGGGVRSRVLARTMKGRASRNVLRDEMADVAH